MDLNYLIDYAKSMAKESFIYREAYDSNNADAFWFEDEELKFLVKFENDWWGISIIAQEDRDLVTFEKQPDAENIIAEKQGIPLQKEPMLSYPSLDYVFYNADKEIEDWLTSLKWGKDWGFNGNFKDPIGQQYVNWWMDNYPFYASEGIFAIEKGWAMIWPDDDEPLQYDPNNEFLFCTLYEAEPWLEVYRKSDTGEFVGYERIT